MKRNQNNISVVVVIGIYWYFDQGFVSQTKVLISKAAANKGLQILKPAAGSSRRIDREGKLE